MCGASFSSSPVEARIVRIGASMASAQPMGHVPNTPIATPYVAAGFFAAPSQFLGDMPFDVGDGRFDKIQTNERTNERTNRKSSIALSIFISCRSIYFTVCDFSTPPHFPNQAIPSLGLYG